MIGFIAEIGQDDDFYKHRDQLLGLKVMYRAEDMGDYFRIPADNRDMNYNSYFSEGDDKISKVEEYTSHNTTRLDIEGTKKLLLKLDFIRTNVNDRSTDYID